MQKNTPLETMYMEYANTVKHFLISLCGNFDLAEDLTQETFYQAYKWACEKTKVFSCVLLLIDTTVVIFYKKVYTPPFPIRMLLWNPMRQLRLFSVYCDIYKDCVQ